jgi:hypothetical protein
MDMLTESILLDYAPKDNKLEFLEEYLIVTPSITLQEAKSLIKLIHEMGVDAAEQVNVKAEAKVGVLKRTYAKMVKAAKSAGTYTAEKAKALKDWLAGKIKAVWEWAKRMKDAIKGGAKKSAGYVATKYKAGVSLAKAHPKSAIGLGIAAGAAAAGGGYVAYKKYKEKKK